jgi:signal transduction histidine kinase
MPTVRRSLTLFLALVVCLAAWQVWLTWRLTEQDRNLQLQRSRERLSQVADLVVAQLVSTLGNWDLSLRELAALPPSPALEARLPAEADLILLAPGTANSYPGPRLLFVPDPPSPHREVTQEFSAEEQLEFQEQRIESALEALRPLMQKDVTRAEALLRKARLERKLARPEAALATYERLSRDAAVSPTGAPYALLAAAARCQMLAGPPASPHAALEIESLRQALLEGRWQLRRETFEYYWGEVNRLRNTSDDPPHERFELAALAARLYDRWQGPVHTGSSASGREAQPDASLLVWQATPTRLTALRTRPGWVASRVKLPQNSQDIRWRLVAAGTPGVSDSAVTRSLAEALIPGRIEFHSVASPAPGHRALWLAGVALTLLLVLAGAYAMYRGVNRELHVARLQSDFVAAVSHEFRSPLTTLRTITELLAQDRIPEESRRRQSYQYLDRETTRLHRLVEDLLDFGRMESGRRQFHMETHDAFALVRAAVADFREEAMANGFEIELHLDSGVASIEADEEALRRALRNLLENAVKYSPGCRTVWVEGSVNHRQVAVSVRDRGMGIESREQRDVFQKFVRGAAAKKAGIKGTGIGLSMVRQIVDACGGQIRLESAVSAGSTFIILLPLSGNGEDA